MHRSGTSLLTSLLPPLGVAVPGPLIGADIHNPEGYYERSDITALQEQLLIDLGRWWPSRSGVEPLPVSWREHPGSRPLVARLTAVLRAEAERQRGPWAIKDPRTSLLLPLWRQVTAELAIPLRIVLGVRDPREVATSLLRRDRQAAGMTAWRAQQLWWRHNLQVLRDSEQLPLLVVHYSRWFQPYPAHQAEEQLRNLAHFCLDAMPSGPALEQALARIEPRHRRSRPGLGPALPIHPRLRRLERRLLALADGQLERAQLEARLQRAPIPLPLLVRGATPRVPVSARPPC